MSHSILVIDDSQSFRQQVTIALEMKGHDCTTAGDGIEGLEVLKKNADFKLIICDVNMPRLDGLSMIERMRADKIYDGPIIMLTTEGDRGLIDKGKNLGVACWMVKPFDPEALNKIVDKLTST